MSQVLEITFSIPSAWRTLGDNNAPPRAAAFYQHAVGCATCAAVLDSPDTGAPVDLCPAGLSAFKAMVAEFDLVVRKKLGGRP